MNGIDYICFVYGFCLRVFSLIIFPDEAIGEIHWGQEIIKDLFCTLNFLFAATAGVALILSIFVHHKYHFSVENEKLLSIKGTTPCWKEAI